MIKTGSFRIVPAQSGAARQDLHTASHICLNLVSYFSFRHLVTAQIKETVLPDGRWTFDFNIPCVGRHIRQKAKPCLTIIILAFSCSAFVVRNEGSVISRCASEITDVYNFYVQVTDGGQLKANFSTTIYILGA